MAPIKLCTENLAKISNKNNTTAEASPNATAPAVLVPNYTRSSLSPGIVHFGVGNFHRSHMCVYLDELFRMGRCLDWAVVGASMMAQDAEMRNKLVAQDYLSTVVEQSAEHNSVRVIGTMLDHLPVGDGQAIIEQLSQPSIRIVSLTITEGGYFIDASTGTFASDHPAIQADAQEPNNPKTVFGLITAALRNRRFKGIPPFTVLSCDNIVQNGKAARNAVLGMARLWANEELTQWIGDSVAFPNGMVDRITPATGQNEIRKCREQFGIEDAHPVFCEQFKQWVIEDHFPMGRPDLELVGVQFVKDVLPFEQMKLRILNGGHALIAYPSGLLGIEIGHVAMQHPLINGFLRKVEETEIIPTVSPVPGTDLHTYFRTCAERFANPKIDDTIRRLCYDGSNRQPKFIVPTIEDALQHKGLSVQGLALACALWCRYCYGETVDGTAIAPNDPHWAKLKAKATEAKQNPTVWLSEQKECYGNKVSGSARFRHCFGAALAALWQEGVESVLEKYINGTLPSEVMPTTTETTAAAAE